jgi:two-component system, sensor histidine kinase and response regulator
LHDISPATITADERRLAQVLSNLVSNAIKYTYPSTTIYIQGMIDEKSYQIDVIDQGRGIDPQEVDKLFKPFSQLSNEPTGGENSTGLGLWIVQQMVQAQGGEVGVNLEVSDGANFWVRFPLAT